MFKVFLEGREMDGGEKRKLAGIYKNLVHFGTFTSLLSLISLHPNIGIWHQKMLFDMVILHKYGRLLDSFLETVPLTS